MTQATVVRNGFFIVRASEKDYGDDEYTNGRVGPYTKLTEAQRDAMRIGDPYYCGGTIEQYKNGHLIRKFEYGEGGKWRKTWEKTV